MNLAICDICGTLVYENTTRGFLNWLSRRGVRNREIQAALSRPVSWFDTKTHVNIGRRWLIWSLRSLEREFLEAEARAYVSNALATVGRQRLLEELRHHRSTGGQLILASSTLDPVATAVASQLEAHAVFSSNLGYDERGRCFGRLSDDVTGRKWDVVEPIVQSIRPTHIVVYTDNREDLDLMRRAHRVFFYGHPPAVAERELGPGRLTALPWEAP